MNREHPARRYACAVRYSGTERDDDSPGWFRVRGVDVTTASLIVLVWVVTLIIWMLEPVSKPINYAMAFIPADVTSGDVWQLVSWPFAHAPTSPGDEDFDLWDIINAAFFWLFATELERQTGRRSFAILLASSIVIIPLAAVLWSQLLGDQTVFAGLSLLGLVVVLIYCAEHPTRPFFFGIPAWAIAGVIVALEIVNDIGTRDWIRLLTVLLAAALITLVARKVDLLTDYKYVPDLRLPSRKRDAGAAKSKVAKRGGAGAGRGRASSAPSESKRSLWGRGRKEQNEPAEIVQMPQRPRPAPPTGAEADFSADDIALDLLLDKISAGGLDSLTDNERQALDELRARRRNRPKP